MTCLHQKTIAEYLLENCNFIIGYEAKQCVTERQEKCAQCDEG